MIINDKRKMAQMIVARLKPSSGEMTMPRPEIKMHEDEAMDENKEGLKAIAEEIMHAFEMKDAMGLAEALCDFFDMKDSLPHEEYEPSEEEKHEE